MIIIKDSDLDIIKRKKITISVRLNPDCYDKLKTVSKKENLAISSMINYIVEQYLK